MPVSQACCRCAAVVCSCSLPGNRVVPVHFGAVCVGMGDKMQGPWSIVLVEASSADGPYLVHNKRAAVTVHESASDGDEDIVQLNLYCKQPVFNDEKADEKSTLFAYQLGSALSSLNTGCLQYRLSCTMSSSPSLALSCTVTAARRHLSGLNRKLSWQGRLHTKLRDFQSDHEIIEIRSRTAPREHLSSLLKCVT